MLRNEINQNSSVSRSLLVVKKIKEYWQYPIVAIIIAVICVTLGEPYDRQDSHFWRMWLAVGGASFVFLRLLISKIVKIKKELIIDITKRVYLSILTGAIVFGVFNYYQFDKKWAKGLDDYTDIAYYYLNTKYLNELGYMGFYAAMLTADKEYKNRHASHIKGYRDLRDYEMKSTKVAFAHGKEIRDNNFSAERWKQFQKDCDYFMRRKNRMSLQQHFFTDHGYNPPPTWAVPGIILTSLAKVGNIKYIAMADVAWVVAMLCIVAWAFGYEVMLYVSLFFFCTFSGRWPVLGQSLLRFDWSCALVMGIAFMKKERFIASGAFMAYAALNRIFPAIFFFPWLVLAIRQIVKERRVPKEHIQFAAAAAAVTIVLVISALALFGPEKIEESARNLIMHNNSYSSHRVGLGDLFVYEGETTYEDIRKSGGLHPKELKIQSIKPALWLFGGGALLIIGLYVVRTKRNLYELIHLGTIPLFAMTNAQINYYNLRMVLVLWHTSQMTKNPIYHGLGMVMLFVTEVLTQKAQWDRDHRYLVTTTTSFCLAVYYSVMIIWMLFEIAQSFLPKKEK